MHFFKGLPLLIITALLVYFSFIKYLFSGQLLFNASAKVAGIELYVSSSIFVALNMLFQSVFERSLQVFFSKIVNSAQLSRMVSELTSQFCHRGFGGTYITMRLGTSIVKRKDIGSLSTKHIFKCSVIMVKGGRARKQLTVVCIYRAPDTSQPDFFMVS